jgi:dGTPase
VELLKKLMSVYVFNNPALVAQQFGQRQVIRKLFEILFEAAQPSSTDSGIIMQPFQDLLQSVDVTEDRERARIVADLIASMTEQQALLFHQRLLGLSPGSVRDLIIR